MAAAAPRKFRLYSVWHHKLFDELIQVDRPENRDALVFYGVNPRYEKVYSRDRGYNILWEHELPVYDPHWQERGYCQTTCMMHLYWNRDTHLADLGDEDYIGFMQYDMSITDGAMDAIRATIQPDAVAGKIVMHELYHRLIEEIGTVRGLALPYENSVLEDYNRHFSTDIRADVLLNNEWAHGLPMMLLHTFLIPKGLFLRMMDWMCTLLPRLDTHYTDVTDYYQAGFAERIHALFIALEFYQRPEAYVLCKLPVEHHWPYYHDHTQFDDYKKMSS